MIVEPAFLIRSPEQIIHKLVILCRNKCLLNVSFSDSAETFITTILEVNKKDNNVVFYHGPHKKQIEKLYKSLDLAFKTEYLGVKISFNGSNLEEIRHYGASAFRMHIPDSLAWVEARDYHRVKIPASKPSFCLLMLNGRESVKLKLYDISLTGFSVLNDSEEISKIMNPNIHFKDCKLLLADSNEGIVSFEIRHRLLIQREYIKSIEKIGCKFTGITNSFENTIQGYMMQIERGYRQNTSAEYEPRPQH
ncbi:MAG: flagellar brake protein [Methylovulum sp.]|nr:flagellar brake protein [Methylovulum sp.]